MVAGTEGYENYILRFIESSQNLDFNEVCKDFIAFLPSKPAYVLDVGSGAGQNAASLAAQGFTVTAVEPMPEFVDAAKKTYKGSPVKWLSGSLPDISCLSSDSGQFDFVLIDGVWHHLEKAEREMAVMRLSALIKQGGKCAISLRNGPAGMGSKVYPTDSKITVESFENHGFECIFHLKNQSSILPNKENVKWSRIVLQKC
ncbi:MAG: class I SAM-dependent methyltransferase [Gammaproteobacteria bacterium]|nr:class I SAM-dependent methyltransferase [Gammaproteobacteria bacterium]